MAAAVGMPPHSDPRAVMRAGFDAIQVRLVRRALLVPHDPKPLMRRRAVRGVSGARGDAIAIAIAAMAQERAALEQLEPAQGGGAGLGVGVVDQLPDLRDRGLIVALLH